MAVSQLSKDESEVSPQVLRRIDLVARNDRIVTEVSARIACPGNLHPLAVRELHTVLRQCLPMLDWLIKWKLHLIIADPSTLAATAKESRAEEDAKNAKEINESDPG